MATGSVIGGTLANKTYYKAQSGKSVAKSTTGTLASITIAQSGTYLVCGFVACSSSNTSAQSVNLVAASTTNVTTFPSCTVRGTNANGGGVFTAAPLVCTGSVTINLTTYNYYTSALTFSGYIFAFRLIK